MKNLNISLEEIKINISALFDQYLVNRAAVFGSCARGQVNPESDVDLLVSFQKPIGLFKFIEFKQKLEAKLHCKVDLITYNALNDSDIKEEVLREAVEIYDQRH